MAVREFFHRCGMGMQLILHTATYAAAMLLCKCAVSLIAGDGSIETAAVLQMMAMALLFALIEAQLFPVGVIFLPSMLAFRSLIWVATCNLLFAGGAMYFRWFPGIPIWGSRLLLLLLELSLAAMWFGMHVVLRIQTAEIHRSFHLRHEK